MKMSYVLGICVLLFILTFEILLDIKDGLNDLGIVATSISVFSLSYTILSSRNAVVKWSQ